MACTKLTSMRVSRLLLSALALTVAACSDKSASPAPGEPVTIVFKHGKLFGDPRAFDALIKRFEDNHTGIRVRTESLPASSDEQHQFYVINLRAASADFDVMALDVIWVAEFARAGWLNDLTETFVPADRKNFFKGPLAAIRYQDRTYAIPWFIDAGVLYYRKDLLAKYEFEPPRTWEELSNIAAAIKQREPGMYGFVWQGKQYEGLICNALEYIWSAGGDAVRDGRVVLDSPENRRALGFMRALVHERGISPELVTTATEEPSRRIFGSGKAVFMRNWPYAWTLFEQPNSPVKGKVGITALPHFSGHDSAATLGGWQLGVSKYSRHPKEAAVFAQFMTSAEALKALALAYGLNPSRRTLYDDPDLIAAQPHMAQLRATFEHARPRPVTPQYVRVSQVLQSEFSAVVAGLKPPEDALASAQHQVEAILKR
ncbi:MAG TPA: ABC transporter substrate-binding protein [Burkholderiales bacterium]